MSAQSSVLKEVTLQLPESLYESIRRAADQVHRPLKDLLLDAVAAVAPTLSRPQAIERTALAQMSYLNDAALWQAARSAMTPEQRTRLESLHHQQQREPLTEAERTEEQSLIKLYQETLLIRAQAAVLLKQRGYDIGDPRQFAPVE